jgi:hypothetical protein
MKTAKNQRWSYLSGVLIVELISDLKPGGQYHKHKVDCKILISNRYSYKAKKIAQDFTPFPETTDENLATTNCWKYLPGQDAIDVA